MLLRQHGWTPIYKEYPPFYKMVQVYIAELNVFVIGKIIMIGNKICIPSGSDRYFDLDNYWGVYWKLKDLTK